MKVSENLKDKINSEQFEGAILNKRSQVLIARDERAYYALYAYEQSLLIYKEVHSLAAPSGGHPMSAFALGYDVTVKEMSRHYRAVEKSLRESAWRICSHKLRKKSFNENFLVEFNKCKNCGLISKRK